MDPNPEETSYQKMPELMNENQNAQDEKEGQDIDCQQ